jgi:Holliday junction resolvasome RuvABC ATP-dependent DNA helicase subunit
MDANALDITKRIVLVFGAALASDGWMDAKQVVPLVGGNGAAWEDVQRALASLEEAGYLVRAEHGNTWLYRREQLGQEAAAQILQDDGLPLIAEAATAGKRISAWRPDTGAPESLDDIVGQVNALYQIQLNVDWALATGRSAKPMLFSGPSGYGKTMVGGLVSRELRVPWLRLSMAEAEIEHVELALEAVAKGGVLFFDEIHAAKKRLLNSLLVALDYGELRFTPIAATTDVGSLKTDLVRRFRRVIEFEPYRIEEAEQIATSQAVARGTELRPPLQALIARAARCNPARIAVFVDECLMLEARLGRAPSKADFLEHLRRRGTDPRGIEELDRRLLSALSQLFEGTAGIHRLAVSVEIGPEHALGRLHDLAREGLVRAAGRSGWTITRLGLRYLRTS